MSSYFPAVCSICLVRSLVPSASITSAPSILWYIPFQVPSNSYLKDLIIQITGLLCQAVIGFIMSGLYKQYVWTRKYARVCYSLLIRLTNHVAAFAVVYGIFLSFGEFGPGNCLGMLAAKTGSTAIRGQFYGIAAAVGKIGAFAGTWAFPAMIDGEYVSFGAAENLVILMRFARLWRFKH